MKRPTGDAARSFVFAALLVVLPAAAGAQSAKAGQGPQQPIAIEKPAKVPAPPLFPKHRRGLYRNGSNIEVIDATPQSPPLEVDDPGVPDKGEWEINIGTDADLGTERRGNFLLIDANYGVQATIMGRELPMQLKVEFQYAGLKESGAPLALGVGDTALGLKVNFLQNEHTGLSAAFYPQLKFSTHRSIEDGLADPGQTFVLPLLVSKETHLAVLALNAGIEAPIHDPQRKMATILAVGVGRPLTRKLAAMADIHTESSLNFKDDRMVDVNMGVIYGLGSLPVYAKVGHSVHADGGGHAYFAFGGKVFLPMRH